MKRRDALLGGLALSSGLCGARAEAKPLTSEQLAMAELQLPGDRAFGRALLFTPKKLGPRPELLILLHGLGETHDQVVGMRAFAERYGLLQAVARLSQPPLSRTLPKQEYFGDGRLDELNARLQSRPFRCPVLLCPFTPNPYKSGGGALLGRYGEFLVGALKAEVEGRVGVSFPSERCFISGVSLGGYVALESFVRKPEAFGGLGVVQGAFAAAQAGRYAEAIRAASERLGPRHVEILSSSLDPYRKPSEALYQQLQRRQVSSRLRVSPGPHDQAWLRESGVIELLLGAEYAFSEERGAAP